MFNAPYLFILGDCIMILINKLVLVFAESFGQVHNPVNVDGISDITFSIQESK